MPRNLARGLPLHTPAIPLLKLVTTVIMIITLSMAFTVGQRLFSDLGSVLEFFRYVHPVVLVFFGVCLGMAVLIFLSLADRIRTWVGFIIMAMIVFVIFVIPLLSAPMGTDYYWDVVQGNYQNTFVGVGNVGIHLFTILPAMLGFLGIWRENESFTALTLVLASVPPTYTAFVSGLDQMAIVLPYLMVFYIALAGMIADIRYFTYPEKDLDEEASRRIITILFRAVTFLIPFTVIFILTSLITAMATDILLALSPEIVARSVEMEHTVYITAGALFDVLVAFWITGLVLRHGPGALRKWLVTRREALLYGRRR